MTWSPNVDRISLDDRINALEARLPSPGPGSSNMDTFILDPKIVDQCKDNAWTDIGVGLVLKINIPNLYALNPSPDGAGKFMNNLEILAAVFIPMAFGVYGGVSTVFYRFRATSTITNLPPPDNSQGTKFFYSPTIDMTALNNAVFQYMGPATITLKMPGGYVTMRLNNNIIGRWLGPTDHIIQIIKPASGALTMKFGFSTTGSQYNGTTNKYTYLPALPCVSFGCFRCSPFVPFGMNYSDYGMYIGSEQPPSYTISFANIAWTGDLPSGLPAHLRHSYPPTWYT